MLPGIRFLFVAVVFAFSLVIFGMGAAALLRSAHEEFASLPTRRMAPPTVFAQQPIEAQPTLSMLRVETPAPDVAQAPPVSLAPAIQESVVSATDVQTDRKATAPERIANLSLPTPAIADAPAASVDIKTTDIKTPDIKTSDETKIDVPAPVTTVAVAPSAPIETAAPPAVAPVAAIPAPTQTVEAPALETPAVEAPTDPQTTATLTDKDAQLSSSTVAVLSDPPVDIGRVPLPVAKPAVVPVKKVAKKTPPKRRRVAAIRQVAPPAAQQTDPFGQPLGR